MRGTLFQAILVFALFGQPLLFAVTTDTTGLIEVDSAAADEKLAEKVLKLLEAPSLANRQTSGNNDGKNALDGNSYLSTTTYHSEVWEYCVEWTEDETSCNKWLDPYVSRHGLEKGDDKSPLEGAIAQFWESLAKTVEEVIELAGKGPLKEYSIWDIEAKDPQESVIREYGDEKEGSLDRSKLKDFRLKDEVAQKAEEIGTQASDKNIETLTYDEGAENPDDVLVAPETLRAQATSATRSFRNRILSNIGTIRASQPGIEFELSEGMPNCDAYLQAAKKYEDKRDAPITPQDRLLYETNAHDLQERYKWCQQAMAQSAREATQIPEEISNSPGDDQVDLWKNKLNLAAVDYVGIDVNRLGKPQDATLKDSDVKVEMIEYDEGGKSFKRVKKTNAEVLASYNKNLKEAAAEMEKIKPLLPREIASQEDFSSEKIKSYQIAPESIDMVSVNGFTPIMVEELQKTKISKSPIFKQNKAVSTQTQRPEAYLEEKPSELVVTPTL